MRVGDYSSPMRFLLALLCLLASPAWAQVSTNEHALDQLTPAPAKPTTHAAAPPAKTPARRAKPTHSTATPAKPRLTAPRMPLAPPVHPVIQPPAFTMPAHAPPPPPPVPVRADAPGAASAIPGGTRITFGPGVSDLNPATLAAVEAIATQALAKPDLIVDVTAWAPGTADDPSTARRLSLDRALAARAVMIHAGLVSDRIRAVAKGSGEVGAGPADRAEIVVEGGGRK